MNPSIFKAYDIRGIYPEELDEDAAFKIGAAFAKFTKAKRILLGEDSRNSTPALKKALINGLETKKIEIFDAGKLTTPMFYFAVAENKVDAGIMITASHNPGQYNGFKLVRGDALPIEPKAILPKISNFKLQISNLKQKTKIQKINIAEAYTSKLLTLADVSKIKELKIAIDAGNGMAGTILPKLLEKLPQIMAEELFFETDMSFPNHEANPLKEETLSDLKAAVLKNGAHLGVAYDGDADRIGFVDEKGELIGSDVILALLAPQILARSPGSAVLYDLRCSKIVPEEIERLGGKAVMTRVGHAFIKKDLRKHSAAAAGELSSHFYFKNFYGVECSDLVLLYLLLELSKQNKPFSEIVKPLRKYHHSGEINFEVKDKEKIIDRLKLKYIKTAVDFTEIDGVRMEFKKDGMWWWFSVRASNTEPLLRLNLESNNAELLAEKTRELSNIIRQ